MFYSGMSSPENKDQFLKQFERIVDGIKASRAKVGKKRGGPPRDGKEENRVFQG